MARRETYIAGQRKRSPSIFVLPPPVAIGVSRNTAAQAHHSAPSLTSGLCQQPSEAMIASASFGPQPPRL